MSLNADLGIAYLKQAVLDVMPKNKGIISLAEISKKAHIFRDRGIDDSMNDAITQGIVNLLQSDELIERVKPTKKRGRDGGWKLK